MYRYSSLNIWPEQLQGRIQDFQKEGAGMECAWEGRLWKHSFWAWILTKTALKHQQVIKACMKLHRHVHTQMSMKSAVTPSNALEELFLTLDTCKYTKKMVLSWTWTSRYIESKAGVQARSDVQRLLYLHSTHLNIWPLQVKCLATTLSVRSHAPTLVVLCNQSTWTLILMSVEVVSNQGDHSVVNNNVARKHLKGSEPEWSNPQMLS